MVFNCFPAIGFTYIHIIFWKYPKLCWASQGTVC